MKKSINFLILLLILSLAGNAQQNVDQRRLSTRIADLLAQIPSQNEEQHNKNMQEIAGMGEAGLTEMAGMMVPPGQGDNSLLQYALGGFSFYVTNTKNEDLRKIATAAYCKALTNTTDKDNQAFLISQLQLVGKDDAVDCVKGYFTDDRLCGPAARALVKVNSDLAINTLVQALQNTQGSCQLSLIEALGDLQASKTASIISSLSTSNDINFKKVVLHSLAQIGDPASEQVLFNASKESGFAFESTNSTASLILYIKRLAENEHREQADKLATTLLNNTNAELQVHTKSAALAILADIRAEKAMPLILEAAVDKNKEYRAAAMQISSSFSGKLIEDQWIKTLKRANAEVQAEIITMFGNTQWETALPEILKLMKSKYPGVRLAAIEASGKLGQEKSLDQLLQIIKTANKDEVNSVKSALLTMKGENMVAKVGNALPTVKSAAKAALIDVLAARGTNSKINEVLAEVNNTDTLVSSSALRALETMVRKEDLPQLFPLLTQQKNEAQIKDLQKAIIAAAKDIKDEDQQIKAVLDQYHKESTASKHLYFPVLAQLGGGQALEAVYAAFGNEDKETKKAALEALISWTDASAAPYLYRIGTKESNSGYLDQVIQGYVRAISIANIPGDQKLLMLRNAMEIANTSSQKQRIIREAGRVHTYPSLMYLGKFLDDPALQQDAARGIINIALSDNKFNGTMVRNLIENTIQVLKGQDSEYVKESLVKFLSEMPAGIGFLPAFNGKDLTGWKGLVTDPIKRVKMDAKTLAQEQKKADEVMRSGWSVKDGMLVFNGHGENICTDKKYGDFEMFVDWKILKDGDAGIYLRGTPQVQIWDPARTDVGAEVGSGGLYNNEKNPSKPLKFADNPIGEWNTFHIVMKGDKVTVYLNGELVVDSVTMENYWNRNMPLFPEEQIELQAHGTEVFYRDIYIKDISKPQPYKLTADEQKQGFKVLFDGTSMENWTGNTKDYIIEDGDLVIYPERGGRGNLYTKEEFGDFIFRFEFQLTPGANNGLGIRAPMEGDAAYTGMELQILDNEADIYKTLEPYQYHGSVYGVIPAKRGFLKPTGEWNLQEVIVNGAKIKITLNGTVILDGDLSNARKTGTLDGKDHPGIHRNTGHIAFLGHGSIVRFKNIRIKDLSGKK